MKLDIT